MLVVLSFVDPEQCRLSGGGRKHRQFLHAGHVLQNDRGRGGCIHGQLLIECNGPLIAAHIRRCYHLQTKIYANPMHFCAYVFIVFKIRLLTDYLLITHYGDGNKQTMYKLKPCKN